jgi:dCMP deaminase
MRKEKWDQRYLSLAREVSTWSKDPSRQIGAVAIGAQGQVLSQGFNGFPRGIFDTEDRYTDRQVKYQYVVHAEMNCIYNATLNGVSLNGAHLYVWGLPVCSECSKGIIQVGIKKVFWSTDKEVPDVWAKSLELTEGMLKEAGVELNRLHSE